MGAGAVNPCGSPWHPAAIAGVSAGPATAADVAADPRGLPVQVAYTPGSTCFGCGPSHGAVDPAPGDDPNAPPGPGAGLGLRSYRSPAAPDGLEGEVVVDRRFEAFPGVVSGGVVATLLECHGSWTASLALMDRRCLPHPPLTMTRSLTVEYSRTVPPGTPLRLVSTVVNVRPSRRDRFKSVVEVEQTLSGADGRGRENTTLARCTGAFVQVGAMRVDTMV